MATASPSSSGSWTTSPAHCRWAPGLDPPEVPAADLVRLARLDDAAVNLRLLPMASTYNLAVIPGDGIGGEVTTEALKVLDAVSGAAQDSFTATTYDLGAQRYLATGETLPDSVLEELRGHDAILLGAVGDPSVPPGVLERGLLLRLRFALDHHVNLRPVKLFRGVTRPLASKGPDEIDFRGVPRGY